MLDYDKKNIFLNILSTPKYFNILGKLDAQNNSETHKNNIPDKTLLTDPQNETNQECFSNIHSTGKRNDSVLYLVRNGMVDKSGDDEYTLSSLGKTMMTQVKAFKFLHKHRDYFSDHYFGDAPSSLVMQAGRLLNCEFLDGLPSNFIRWKQMMDDADKYVNCIFTHPPMLLADWIIPKLPNLEVCLLFGKNTVVKECGDFVNKLELAKHSATYGDGIIEKKMCDQVLLNIIMTEKHACLMFPRKDDVKNTTDMHASFASSETEFYGWCMDFFRYKWNDSNSKHFSRFRF